MRKRDFVLKKGVLEKYTGAGGDVVIPEGVTKIDIQAFENCESLTGVIVPEGVTRIEYAAFRHCVNLTRVELPNTLTDIGSDAFARCKALRDIRIPDSVTHLGFSAFRGCRKLCDAEGFLILRQRLFDYCGAGGDVVIPGNITEIDTGAFAYAVNITSLVIPETVTKIGRNAFLQCKELTAVGIRGLVSYLGREAFAGCEKLAMVEIPNGVITIGERVFEGCSNRLRIRIPNLDVLPHSLCPHAALCFAEDGGSPEDPRYENYGQYLKAHAEKMAVFAVKHGVLIAMLCREKWIKAKSMEVFMTAAEQTGDGEVIAMLLDYQHNQLTAREKAQVEKAKEKQREKELSFLEE